MYRANSCAAHFLDNGHGFAVYQRQRCGLEAFDWFCHPAKPLLQHIEAQTPITSEAVVITGVAPETLQPCAPGHWRHLCGQKNRNHKLAGFIDGHHTGIGGLVNQMRRNQSLRPLWPERNELLIAAEEPGNLCR